MRPNEIQDKKRNTAKRSFCLFAFDHSPIDRTRRAGAMIRTGSNGRFMRFEDEQKQTGPDRGVFLSAWVFRATSGGARFDSSDVDLRRRGSKLVRRAFTDLTPFSVVHLVADIAWRTIDERWTIYGECGPPSNPTSFYTALIGLAIKYKHRARTYEVRSCEPPCSRSLTNRESNEINCISILCPDRSAKTRCLRRPGYIDPTRGRPSIDEDRQFGAPARARFCPWWLPGRVACCPAPQYDPNDAPIFATLTSDF